MSILVILCTCPDGDVAERIARALVEERLAACVNQLPGLRSIYRWQGQVCTDTEVLLLVKAPRERFEAVKARILELHPYSLPEVIGVEVAAGLDRYLAWVADETRSQ